MDLLERDHILDTLRQRLHDAAAKHGRLVLIGGEAGVGKTTFSGIGDSHGYGVAAQMCNGTECTHEKVPSSNVFPHPRR